MKSHTCPIIDTFGHHLWKALAPDPNSGGTPNSEVGTQSTKGLQYQLKPRPLLVIYTYSLSVSKYTCHPNIHYLFCLTNWNDHTLVVERDFRMVSTQHFTPLTTCIVQRKSWDRVQKLHPLLCAFQKMYSCIKGLSRSIWTPGPNSTEVFGPPLKFLDPPI